MSLGRPPVRRKGDQFVIAIGADERAVLTHMLRELSEMLDESLHAASDDGSHEMNDMNDALGRLFPVVYDTDPEREAEYQRLMRDELVTSKQSAIKIVTDAFASARRNQVVVDEAGLVAVMQSINSVRLVLGTIVGIDRIDELEALSELSADDEEVSSPEFQLYGYLSWLLDWCVGAISGRTD